MTGLLALLDHIDGRGIDHMGGSWMWLWGVPMMFLLLFVIALIFRGNSGLPGSPPRSDLNSQGRAREILAERYAKGELSTEEYRERKAELE